MNILSPFERAYTRENQMISSVLGIVNKYIEETCAEFLQIMENLESHGILVKVMESHGILKSSKSMNPVFGSWVVSKTSVLAMNNGKLFNINFMQCASLFWSAKILSCYFLHRCLLPCWLMAQHLNCSTFLAALGRK